MIALGILLSFYCIVVSIICGIWLIDDWSYIAIVGKTVVTMGSIMVALMITDMISSW